MKKKKLTFKAAYLIYLIVLAVLVALASFYVNNLLQQYEDTRPEKYVENAIEELKKEAAEGKIWQTYFLPKTETGEYETTINVEKAYEARLINGELEYFQKSGDYPEDELYYVVHHNGAPLAEVKLKAKGEAVTKLAILSYREWNVEYVKPIVEKNDYTILVPEDFSVKANQIALLPENGTQNDNGEIKYTVSGVYFAPEFEIKDGNGQAVSYEFQDKKVVAKYYYYSLVLPDTLTVKLNGKTMEGRAQADHTAVYEIKELDQPEVLISDYYGNVISYEGGMRIPLTHRLISAENGYEVEVLDAAVPKEAVSKQENPEYEALKEYVEDLPQVSFYNVAVLKDNAKVCVKDKEGRETLLEGDETEYSFTAQDKYLDEVPKEISNEVDVLALAQKWSLFMSADLSFKEMSEYLIKDSYQYTVAYKYATGIDIKFISEHILANPAFTQESVSNFVWITDNSFSVDISFVKNMILTVGSKREDPMNDRFYFVKYDDTDDNVDNPTWKIVSMKEIVNHAE